MKYLIVVIILGLFLSCSIRGLKAESTCINFDMLESNGTEFVLDNKLYTGCVERFNDKGEIKLKFTLVKGIMEGGFTDYAKGRVIRKGNYSNNLISGAVFTYYPDGEILSKEFYDSTGALNGQTIEYYISGAPKFTFKYQNGKKDGEYIFYHENGSLSDSGMYVNGKVNGLVLGYFDNGTERSWDSLTNGVGQGISIHYLDEFKETFMWGKMQDGLSVGDWYYRLEGDSCFVRTYKGDDYLNESCFCNDLKVPPYKEW